MSSWQIMDVLYSMWSVSCMRKVDSVRICLPFPARVDNDSTVGTERSESESSSYSSSTLMVFTGFCGLALQTEAKWLLL